MPIDQRSPQPPEEGVLNRHRQTDRHTDKHTDGHGNSMTVSAQWGRIREKCDIQHVTMDI